MSKSKIDSPQGEDIEKKLQRKYDRKLGALRKSIRKAGGKTLSRTELKRIRKESLEFVEFSKVLEICHAAPQAATTIEDTKFRGFHYDH